MKGLTGFLFIAILFSGYQAINIDRQIQKMPEYDFVSFTKTLDQIQSCDKLLEKATKMVELLEKADSRANNWKRIAADAWIFATGVLISLLIYISFIVFRKNKTANSNV